MARRPWGKEGKGREGRGVVAREWESRHGVRESKVGKAKQKRNMKLDIYVVGGMG